MKFNMKNRPKPKDFPANKTRHLGIDMTAWKKADDEWFEGLVKELQERLKKETRTEFCQDAYGEAFVSLLKEILGDEK